MNTVTDLRSTLNLPRTTFPMKANLPEAEPRRLERWNGMNLYQKVRQARRGAPLFVLHDGPPYANGHLHTGLVVNKVLKDLMIRSRSLAGFDTPYRPGWDCHGLPIEIQVDKNLGSKKQSLSPLEFRRACRAHAEKFVGIQREGFARLGITGEWEQPYRTMDASYQAVILRELATFVDRGLVYKARQAVHWCINDKTALAEAEVEYDENHESPSIDVAFPLSPTETEKLAQRFPSLTGRRVAALIWTTTPWTLPANRAVAFHPDFDYGFYPVEGRQDVLIVAKALREPSLQRLGASSPGVSLGEALAEAEGAAFEGLRFRHPWLDQDAPGVLGDYVTREAGSGVVHTAPGHGWDDYTTGVRYGFEIYCPVDETGRFEPEVEHFGGQRVFDANPAIVTLLAAKGALLSNSKVRHSYPLCWRCKKPIIFRATAQWFIGLDRSGLRESALAAVEAVRWYPEWARERMHNMIATRPDWCISRQRLWGVPIPAFYCEGCRAILLTADTARAVADIFERESADAWYEREADALLPAGTRCVSCGGTRFTKETDILDVWFDSGSSHAAVLGKRADLPWPADLYLEGSDQHRGWFHSSLLIGVGTRGSAPFRQVVTHGFAVDGEGRKMSKSLGNDVDLPKTIKQYGAEILRLWVAMVDYREDMRISPEMLARVAEAYRKIRNTCRFLLSNLGGFDPAGHGVPQSALEEIDAYALARFREVVRRVRKAYDDYEFHLVYHELLKYCASDLSSFYLDVLKDRLYCEVAGGPRCRSAQTVLYTIADGLARLLAPVLPFTADEVFTAMSGRADGSVHTALFPTVEETDQGLLDRWEMLLEVRSAVTKALEEARARKEIAASQEALVDIEAPSAVLASLKRYGATAAGFPSPLAALFIVSDARAREGSELRVGIERARGAKCERCWNYSEKVGTFAVHPSVCERCASILEAA